MSFIRPVVLVALLVLASAPAATRAGSKYVEAWLAAVPIPAEGEFATPESVVSAFLMAVNKGDLDAAMKCFVIRENFQKVPFAVQVDYTGAISPRRDFPGLDDVRLAKAKEDFDLTWFYLNLIRVNLHDAKKLRGKSILLNYDPSERKRQIEEYEQLHAEGMKLQYALVSSKLFDVVEGTPITRALGASGNKVMSANLKAAGLDMEIQLSLVKLGTNWRIQNVTSLSQYVR